MFNIEDHRRYTPKPKRKAVKSKREQQQKAETKVVLPRQHAKPNFKETSQIECGLLYGAPCRCRRMIGICVNCRREFAVTLGERADVQYATEKGKILNYKCNKCRSYAR